MRIQNIPGSLTNRWILLTIVAWLIVFTIVCTNAFTYLDGKEANDQIKRMQREIESLNKKKRAIEQNTIELDLSDKKLSMILSDLLQACRKSGANLAETKVGLLTENMNYECLPITVTINGDYNNIGTFVNLMEKNLRFRILEVNLSTKETESRSIVSRILAEFIVL